MGTDNASFPRPQLDSEALESGLVRVGTMWRRIEVLDEAGSTNTELAARAKEGAPHGTVLVTEHQTAGKGRRGREFITPSRAALTFSLLVRPDVAPDRLGWLSGMMGVAAVGAVQRVAELEAALKWPNDLMVPAEWRAGSAVDDGKLAGILAEAELSAGEGPAAVVGIGLNVSQSRDELPVDTATSLREEGALALDRNALLAAILGEFEDLYTVWVAAGGDAEDSGLAEAYRELCVTIGHRVRVHLPDDEELEGVVTGVDSDARLRVEGPEGERALHVGDVIHVRPED